MRIVVASGEGDSVPLALRLIQEGHDTWVYIKEPRYRGMLKGLVDQIEHEGEIVAMDPDLVVHLETSVHGLSERLSTRGLNVLGGFKDAVNLEEHRYKALQFAAKNGILIPETLPFVEAPEAIKYLQEVGYRCCVKFDDDGGDKLLSFLGQSNDDVIHFIEQRYDRAKHKGMVVQEFIEGPSEFNVECWFSKGELIWPMNAGMEQKRMLAGDLGPNTGCQSTITWPLSESSMVPWTREMLRTMKEMEYSGPLDMAFKISAMGRFYFLEFTPRLGINAGFGLFDLLDEDLGEWLWNVQQGRMNDMRLVGEWDFLLAISVPPYPYDLPEFYLSGVEVKEPGLMRGDTVWWAGVEARKDRLYTADKTYPIVAHVSHRDGTWQKAVKGAERLAEELKVSSKQYVTDSMQWVGEELKYLKSLGIKGLK